uniref:Uncharacterized protein n=1 Tax=Rhizophora mucronata TaxID=61149 RepID=A0A2P2N9X9_RHIMU
MSFLCLLTENQLLSDTKIICMIMNFSRKSWKIL